MTEKQQQQFNSMRNALLNISRNFENPSQLRKSAIKVYGLDYEEVLEMSYENIKQMAASAVKGIKEIKPRE